MNYDKLMAAARKTNQERDGTDRAVGVAAPGDGPLSLYLTTAMQAIECGIMTDDWACVAEGQAMLEEIEKQLRGDEQPQNR